MASRIADREQDRFVLLASERQRFSAPRVPVDGVVGVLLQIGAGFLGETVGHGGLNRGQWKIVYSIRGGECNVCSPRKRIPVYHLIRGLFFPYKKVVITLFLATSLLNG